MYNLLLHQSICLFFEGWESGGMGHAKKKWDEWWTKWYIIINSQGISKIVILQVTITNIESELRFRIWLLKSQLEYGSQSQLELTLIKYIIVIDDKIKKSIRIDNGMGIHFSPPKEILAILISRKFSKAIFFYR